MEDIKISPSLICMDFLEIGKQISILNKLADLYHFDIIDNHFAPSLGLPKEYLVSLVKVSALPIDVHLMVENVEEICMQLMQFEVEIFTLHIESIVSNAFRLIGKIKNMGRKVGIAINPITPLESLSYIYSIIDKVTVLTFDPGIAGQKLVNVTLDKVSQLSKLKEEKKYMFDIEVDGSCNKNNFRNMKNAGANQFVVGTSGLFSLDQNIEVAWEKMQQYMNSPAD